MDVVGRGAERALLLEGLAGAAPTVLHVHGMPGIGKTAVLGRFAVDAVSRGVQVWQLPRHVAPHDRARELLARVGDANAPTLVIADDAHELARWEHAIVERCEAARGPLTVALGSRLRPGPRWIASELCPTRFVAVEVTSLCRDETRALLADRGVSSDDADRIHRATGGQPFASLLLATSPSILTGSLELGEHATDALVQRLVGEIADVHVREALDLLAMLGTLNQDELGAALGPGVDPARVYDALDRHALAGKGPRGLVVHPIVRTTLLAQLHRRDPGRARTLVAAALPAIEQMLAWPGQPRERALVQLRELVAAAPQTVEMAGMFHADHQVVHPRADELDDAFQLIEAHEGASSRAIAERWVAYDRTSITVVRNAGRVDAVMIRLDLRGPDVPPAITEPAIDRIVDVLVRRGELKPGMLLRSTRFFHSRTHHQMPCPELAALGAAITQQTLETLEPFISIQHLDAHTLVAWSEIIGTFGVEVCHDAAAVVDGRHVVPCVGIVADQGKVFLDVARRAWATSARPAVPADGELTEVVTDALRHMRDLVWLEASPLGARLFGSASAAGRAARLRDWLDAAIADTERMRHGDLVARALRASFGANRTVVEAAASAGMATTTLKRYRKLGIEYIAALAARGVRD